MRLGHNIDRGKYGMVLWDFSGFSVGSCIKVNCYEIQPGKELADVFALMMTRVFFWLAIAITLFWWFVLFSAC